MSRAPVTTGTGTKRHISLYIGPIIAAGLGLFCDVNGLSQAASLTAAISTLTAIWWVFEPVPIPVTSLIPLATFPLFGILSHEQVAGSYGHKLILLLMGGFIMSTAM